MNDTASLLRIVERELWAACPSSCAAHYIIAGGASVPPAAVSGHDNDVMADHSILDPLWRCFRGDRQGSAQAAGLLQTGNAEPEQRALPPSKG
jgi:hypothetical protein